MVLNYSDPRKDSVFANVKPKDWNDANFTLKATEMRFLVTATSVFIFAMAEDVGEVVKWVDSKKDESFKWQPQLICIELHAKPYKKWKAKEETQPAKVEQWACKKIGELDHTKAYKGMIAFQNNPMLDMFITGIAANGQTLPPETLAMMESTAWQVEETDTTLVPADKVAAPKSGGGSWGGSSGQTELEKLNDRLEFIKQQLAASGATYEVKSVGDLSPVVIDDLKGDNQKLVKQVLEGYRFINFH
jgi:hypothetical protein